MKQILDEAPAEINKAEIVDEIARRGHIIEGFNDKSEERKGFSGFAKNLTRSTEGIAPELAKEEGKKGLIGQAVGFGKGIVNSIKNSGETVGNFTSNIGPQTASKFGMPGVLLRNAGNLAGAVASEIPKLQPKGLDERQGSAIESVAELFVPIGTGAKVGATAVTAARSKSALKKVLETIAEPTSKANVKQALLEGRKVEGRTILGLMKRPDQILPSERTQRAAQTIIEQIPNARKLNDQQIIVQADNAIGRIAQELSPQLQDIPLNRSKVGELVDRFKGLQTQLLDESYSPEEINAVKKIGTTFKNSLSEIIDADNLDEAWRVRKLFDDVIPAKVKEAGDLATPGQKAAKEAWLTYRELLNTLLDSNGDEITDEAVKTAFKKMTDLYTAKGNIISRATFDKKGNSTGLKLLLGALGVSGIGAAAAGGVANAVTGD